jgi:uncharacterized protein (DUF1800 family)
MVLSFATIAARRYGYGLKPGEEPAQDVDALMLQVTRGAKAKPRFPQEGITGRRETLGRLVSVRAVESKAAKDGRPNPDLRRETLRDANRLLNGDAMARIVQAVRSENGFYERLSSFWLDHFSVSARKSYEMRMMVPLYEAEALRPNLGGSFADLLRAAILHPAMLIYLDQNRSLGPQSPAAAKRGGGLNENLGRELLELHTMGVGSGYSQADVQAAAMILTGLAVDSRSFEVAFRPQRAEPGAQALLGKTYGTGGRSAADHLDMLADLAERPETARHICSKLVRHFVADTPPQDVVDAMVAAWAESGGNLSAVYRAMLEQKRSFADEPGKVIPPFDYVVSGLRAFGLSSTDMESLLKASEPEVQTEDMAVPAKKQGLQAGAAGAKLTLQALRRMGQPVWQPPSPAGFPDASDAWLSASQLTERIGWARLAARTLGSAQQPMDFLDAALGDAASDNTRRVISQAPSKVHGLTMVLVSPEFNRR